MIDEILELGFDTIEISHGLSVSLLPGIKKAYQAGKFKVSGLHNFCPSPVEVLIDAPDCYEFTSHRSYDRKRALDLTLKTIEYAAEFKASYIVLHMGSVPMKKMTPELTALVQEGKLNTPEFVDLQLKTRERMLKRAVRRQSLFPPVTWHTPEITADISQGSPRSLGLAIVLVHMPAQIAAAGAPGTAAAAAWMQCGSAVKCLRLKMLKIVILFIHQIYLFYLLTHELIHNIIDLLI